MRHAKYELIALRVACCAGDERDVKQLLLREDGGAVLDRVPSESEGHSILPGW